MKNQTDTGLERKGKPGFKLTKLGWIPEEWNLYRMNFLFREMRLGGNYPNSTTVSPFPLIKMGNLGRGKMITNKLEYIPNNIEKNEHDKLRFNDLLFNTRNTLDLVGKVAIWFDELPLAYYNSNLLRLFFKKELVHSNVFMNYLFNSHYVLKQIRSFATGTTSVAAFYSRDFKLIRVALPPLPEQQKIARILSIWDKAIEKTEQLIQAKTQLKKGLMQQLLTGKRRFPAFAKVSLSKKEVEENEWKVNKLRNISQCSDNRRKPINQEERGKMKGDIPYCGANGIMDFINDYLFDEDIILITEDGGYFDEFQTKPIAYRMTGKCWVNNHAHVLKAKKGFNQDFLFYSLVHKNIMRYLNGGTRSKLNKSEMLQIEIYAPKNSLEQEKISALLNSINEEINMMTDIKESIKYQKKGLMQKLLTGEVKV